MLKFGCDPEFFLQDKKGKFISSIGLVGGSKEEPHPIGNGCFVQEDNVAVEFNIPPVDIWTSDLILRSEEDIFNEIKGNFNYVFDWINTNVCLPNGLVISSAASAYFEPDQLDNEAAQTFGCDPDYNAYTGEENPRPDGPEGFRTAGGHVHSGFIQEVDSLQHCVRSMDTYLGCLSLLQDKDTERRKLYGKAGAHRIKPYGVEYRTLSNYWIFNDDALRQIVNYFRCRHPYAGGRHYKKIEEYSQLAEYAINNNDKDTAKVVLSDVWGVNHV